MGFLIQHENDYSSQPNLKMHNIINISLIHVIHDE